MHFGSDDLKFKFKWFIARAPFSSIPYPIHTNCTPVINYKRWWNDQNHKHVYNKCTNIRLSRGSRVYLLYDHQMMKRQRFSAENSSLSNKSSQKHINYIQLFGQKRATEIVLAQRWSRNQNREHVLVLHVFLKVK